MRVCREQNLACQTDIIYSISFSIHYQNKLAHTAIQTNCYPSYVGLNSCIAKKEIMYSKNDKSSLKMNRIRLKINFMCRLQLRLSAMLREEDSCFHYRYIYYAKFIKFKTDIILNLLFMVEKYAI